MRPVFSYHARSARTDLGDRRSSKLLWLNPASGKTSASPRPLARSPSRRLWAVIGAVLAVALGINSVILGGEPRIVVSAARPGSGPIFLVRSEKTYAQAAQEIISSSILNTNKLSIDTTKVAESMQARFPELERVSVTLPVFGHQPSVYIQPARPALLLKTADGGLYVIDDAGRSLIGASQVAGISKLGLSVIVDQSGLQVRPGETALPSGNVQFITEVLAQLKAKSIATTDASLPKGASELDIRLSGAPYTVRFNLKGEARAGVGTLLAVKKYLDARHITPGSYVDVRVDGKAYYR